ncbi:MAG TPA: hypothetical protein VNN76_06490 [Bacteroidota bacterium]|nr:hypothetical protein [Bacteroidota bacterium]
MPRKKREPEYVLHIFFGKNEETREDVIVFLIQTTKVFLYFNYQILFDGKIKGNTIELNIRGLRTPPVTLPALGPATGRFEIPRVWGIFTLVVKKLKRDVNEFRLEITDSRITVLDSPPKSFLLIQTNQPT